MNSSRTQRVAATSTNAASLSPQHVDDEDVLLHPGPADILDIPSLDELAALHGNDMADTSSWADEVEAMDHEAQATVAHMFRDTDATAPPQGAAPATPNEPKDKGPATGKSSATKLSAGAEADESSRRRLRSTTSTSSTPNKALSGILPRSPEFRTPAPNATPDGRAPDDSDDALLAEDDPLEGGSKAYDYATTSLQDVAHEDDDNASKYAEEDDRRRSLNTNENVVLPDLGERPQHPPKALRKLFRIASHFGVTPFIDILTPEFAERVVTIKILDDWNNVAAIVTMETEETRLMSIDSEYRGGDPKYKYRAKFNTLAWIVIGIGSGIVLALDVDSLAREQGDVAPAQLNHVLPAGLRKLLSDDKNWLIGSGLPAEALDEYRPFGLTLTENIIDSTVLVEYLVRESDIAPCGGDGTGYGRTGLAAVQHMLYGYNVKSMSKAEYEKTFGANGYKKGIWPNYRKPATVFAWRKPHTRHSLLYLALDAMSPLLLAWRVFNYRVRKEAIAPHDSIGSALTQVLDRFRACNGKLVKHSGSKQWHFTLAGDTDNYKDPYTGRRSSHNTTVKNRAVELREALAGDDIDSDFDWGTDQGTQKAMSKYPNAGPDLSDDADSTYDSGPLVITKTRPAANPAPVDIDTAANRDNETPATPEKPDEEDVVAVTIKKDDTKGNTDAAVPRDNDPILNYGHDIKMAMELPLKDMKPIPTGDCLTKHVKTAPQHEDDMMEELQKGIVAQLRGCGCCGSRRHEVRYKGVPRCPVFINQTLRIRDGQDPDDLCTYEYCERKEEHVTERCTTLHGTCKPCRLRGHFEGPLCIETTIEDKLAVFENEADLGRVTAWRSRHMQVGFFVIERHLLRHLEHDNIRYKDLIKNRDPVATRNSLDKRRRRAHDDSKIIYKKKAAAKSTPEGSKDTHKTDNRTPKPRSYVVDMRKAMGHHSSETRPKPSSDRKRSATHTKGDTDSKSQKSVGDFYAQQRTDLRERLQKERERRHRHDD